MDETPSHSKSDLLKVLDRVKINQKSTLYVIQCWLTKKGLLFFISTAWAVFQRVYYLIERSYPSCFNQSERRETRSQSNSTSPIHQLPYRAFNTS